MRAHPVLGGYVEDFTAALATVAERLQFAQKAPAHSHAALDDARVQCDSAVSILKSIEMDMRGAPLTVRTQVNDILPSMREALSRKRAALERLRERSQRDELSIGTRSAAEVQAHNLRATNQLQAQNVERLQNSRRQLSDIENTGSEIMIDLRRQRDVLTNSKANLEETDSWVQGSSRILRSMANHTMCMSALWWVIVLFLLLIIAIIVYVKWLRPKQ